MSGGPAGGIVIGLGGLDALPPLATAPVRVPTGLGWLGRRARWWPWNRAGAAFAAARAPAGAPNDHLLAALAAAAPDVVVVLADEAAAPRYHDGTMPRCVVAPSFESNPTFSGPRFSRMTAVQRITATLALAIEEAMEKERALINCAPYTRFPLPREAVAADADAGDRAAPVAGASGTRAPVLFVLCGDMDLAVCHALGQVIGRAAQASVLRVAVVSPGRLGADGDLRAALLGACRDQDLAAFRRIGLNDLTRPEAKMCRDWAVLAGASRDLRLDWMADTRTATGHVGYALWR